MRPAAFTYSLRGVSFGLSGYCNISQCLYHALGGPWHHSKDIIHVNLHFTLIMILEDGMINSFKNEEKMTKKS